MDRRDFIIKAIGLSFITANSLFAKAKSNHFHISINGDLDDDLIVMKATTKKTSIVDMYQMHNPKFRFNYEGSVYSTKPNPGYLEYSKTFTIKDDEIYCIALANEKDDEEWSINRRERTHYKSEKLLFNNQTFFPAFMPEYNSVPEYPLWFGEKDIPAIPRNDKNGDTYNYYNIFENTIVPFGLVFPRRGNVSIMLFNQNNEIAYTYKSKVRCRVKNIKPNEDISTHPLAEVNNIIHKDTDKQIPNNDYITSAIVNYENKMYTIKLPYPIMYPNQIYVVSLPVTEIEF